MSLCSAFAGDLGKRVKGGSAVRVISQAILPLLHGVCLPLIRYLFRGGGAVVGSAVSVVGSSVVVVGCSRYIHRYGVVELEAFDVVVVGVVVVELDADVPRL